MQSSVPQGSILGLLLLFINVNDLSGVATATSVALFADDARCFWSIKAIEDDAYLQRDLEVSNGVISGNWVLINLSGVSVLSMTLSIIQCPS